MSLAEPSGTKQHRDSKFPLDITWLFVIIDSNLNILLLYFPSINMKKETKLISNVQNKKKELWARLNLENRWEKVSNRSAFSKEENLGRHRDDTIY